MNIRDRHLLGRLERLFAEQEGEAPPDLTDLSDREVQARLADAKHGAIWAARSGDFTHLTERSPFALLSDGEIKARLRRAVRKVAVRKLIAEGVSARSAVALTADGPLPRASGSRRPPDGGEGDGVGGDPRSETIPETPGPDPKREAPGLLAHLNREDDQ